MTDTPPNRTPYGYGLAAPSQGVNTPPFSPAPKPPTPPESPEDTDDIQISAKTLENLINSTRKPTEDLAFHRKLSLVVASISVILAFYNPLLGFVGGMVALSLHKNQKKSDTTLASVAIFFSIVVAILLSIAALHAGVSILQYMNQIK